MIPFAFKVKTSKNGVGRVRKERSGGGKDKEGLQEEKTSGPPFCTFLSRDSQGPRERAEQRCGEGKKNPLILGRLLVTFCGSLLSKITWKKEGTPLKGIMKEERREYRVDSTHTFSDTLPMILGDNSRKLRPLSGTPGGIS